LCLNNCSISPTVLKSSFPMRIHCVGYRLNILVATSSIHNSYRYSNFFNCFYEKLRKKTSSMWKPQSSRCCTANIRASILHATNMPNNSTTISHRSSFILLLPVLIRTISHRTTAGCQVEREEQYKIDSSL
jgi:hypothetical protein